VHVVVVHACALAQGGCRTKGFLLKPALITHRQMNLAVGFLFSGTKQVGGQAVGQNSL
jgi:hypothetical protein